ncbi:hypothetical protein DBR43_27745 [Pedobacter sp. KBW06]|uniref:hypothetical protein n=1 Tax=Pedobacter sp. KBW06 TaxID=2153359 RepID=UPI000F59917A|nr:hypothetical protein [Pedobacter sp. KBW06]RQO66037.1 hypothetical protein DBR43_27745 [Pedobacter sp. KBW06]
MRANLTREDFEEWLFAMSDKLEEFAVFFEQETSKKLSYSPQSINDVEEWLLIKFSSGEEILKAEHQYTLDLVSRYVGETFRENLRGKWDIDLEHEQNVFYHLPVVVADKGFPPIAPYPLITTSVSKRGGSYIGAVLNNALRGGN